jgi:hypothetical protein
MGTAMAANLAAAGRRVVAYVRRPEQMGKLVALGLRPTRTLGRRIRFADATPACGNATRSAESDSWAVSGLIQSLPQCEPAEGYSTALTTDVGSLQPSWGAVEAACRQLRTTATFRPKIPEVLAAVREAGAVYETALRALDELPGQIARAEHAN